MREWYGGDRRIERTLLVLLIRASNRTEIVLGSRARKKVKEAQVRASGCCQRLQPSV